MGDFTHLQLSIKTAQVVLEAFVLAEQALHRLGVPTQVLGLQDGLLLLDARQGLGDIPIEPG